MPPSYTWQGAEGEHGCGPCVQVQQGPDWTPDRKHEGQGGVPCGLGIMQILMPKVMLE